MCSADVFDDSNQVRTHDVDSMNGRDYDSLCLLRWKGMHFIHVNAMSLLPKLDEIGHLATTSKAAVIAVSETWLDNIQYSIFTIQDGEVGLTGYYIHRRDCNRHGGGVCLLIVI